jgi:hypothetical protein
MERQTVAPGIFGHDDSLAKPSIKESSIGKRPGRPPITPHSIPVVENQYPRISFVTKVTFDRCLDTFSSGKLADIS